jgi:hypothetical protein
MPSRSSFDAWLKWVSLGLCALSALFWFASVQCTLRFGLGCVWCEFLGNGQLVLALERAGSRAWVVVEPWLVFVVLSVWTGFVSLLDTKRVRRGRHGYCPHCGYNLAGNVTGRCPECGTPIDPPDQRGAAPGKPD